ncbi:NADH-quinone oxidoreductase subunit NuoN [Marinivivus vitaminiproducens]|uniref:NADH-quinone oxidoreductase subunit NuoN n=1 Tax=Marinivivus vitaminiproducens TaxID=3035935 RepID=UPI0027AA1A6B|nr:NADH-quinone oxidoreductase subunit NuoN [Geminicoccaceae bacterium SCSIO 64248]
MFEPFIALPEILLVLTALVILMTGAFRSDDEGLALVTPIAVGAMAVILLITLLMDSSHRIGFGGHYITDPFSAFAKVLILLGSAVCIVMAPRFMATAGMARYEYVVLALISTTGMMLMVSANSLLALYMALELQSLPIYVMAAFQRDTTRSSEAGLKYFVLGALASGMLLYGCSLIYGFTGTVDFTRLGDMAGAMAADAPTALPTGAVVGLVFVAAGLAFKMSAVPFHMWTPDVYEGAPTPVTAFMAAAPKVAAIALVLRVMMQPFVELVDQWQQIIVFIAVASMILGAFAAIGQTNIKRLLAYSSIGHVGYALVGLAAGTPEGAQGVLIYLAIYVVMTVGTFGVILACRRQDQPIETIDDFAGLAKQHPMLGFAVAIFMFSLAGIPPLAGFWGKWYVFLPAVGAGLWPLALIGLITSVVGAYYYLRVVKVVYFDESREAMDEHIGRELAVITGVSAAFTLLFVLVPGPIVNAAQAAASALAL